MEDSYIADETPAPESISITNTVPTDSRAKIAKRIGIFGLVASLLLSLITVIAVINHKSQSQSNLTALSDALDSFSNTDNSTSTNDVSGDTSWVPTGFTAWPGDSNVAYKFPVTKNCDPYYCIDIQFISHFGCSDFYAAANYLDGGGDGANVLGYDNATLPSLQAMQIAKLRFEDTSNTSLYWQISDITCR